MASMKLTKNPSEYKSSKPFPYIHPQGKIIYLNKDNNFLQKAKELATASGCVKQPTGAVIIANKQIVASGSNAGLRVNVCPRVIEKCPTGTGYHHCKITCQQEGHAELMAAADFRKKGLVGQIAELYLWGHWWCCEPCWQAMVDVGITTVYLQEGATEEFDLDASKIN
jgi:deoxycytidylate deaminase